MIPYPPKYGDGGFSVPFNEPFYDMYRSADGWSPAAAGDGTSPNYRVIYGEPDSGSTYSGWFPRNWNYDQVPPRFGNAAIKKYDLLSPGYTLPVVIQSGALPLALPPPPFTPVFP